MKKIYFLASALLLSMAVSAQDYDLSVQLSNYSAGGTLEFTDDDPVDLSFTFTNEGMVAIPAGTKIRLAFLLVDINAAPGTNNAQVFQTTNNEPGFSARVLLEDLMPKESGTVSFAVGGANSIFTNQDAYELFGEVDPRLCGYAMVRTLPDGATAEVDSDVNESDNQSCIDLDMKAIIGFDELDLTQISVYPNPASNIVNFNLGNSGIELINVLDVSGRIIDVVNVNNSQVSLNIDTYENGIYFYEALKNDEVVKTDKFVVSY